MSLAAGEISPGHVTNVAGDLHSADQAGLYAGHGSLRYQGTDYTILDEAPSKQTLSLSQGDSILDLVPYPEAFQLALSRRFSEFASLRFDPSGLPQVVFHSVGPIQVARQSARAPPHSVSAGTSQTAVQSPAPQAPWSSDLGGGPSSSRLGPHYPPPTRLTRLRSQGEFGFQAGPKDTRRGYGPPVSQPSWADQLEYQDRLDMANYQQWLVETGRQPNYLPPPWVKPQARPKAKRRDKLREASKRRWESEEQDEYGPYSYDPYYYEGQEYGTYDESYVEDDCGYSYCSPRRQDRCPSPPQRFGEQGRYSVRDRVDTPGFVQGGSSTRQEVCRLSPLRGPAQSWLLGVRLLGPRLPKRVVLTVRNELLRLCPPRLDELVPR